ncbi:MAG: O-antigen ligase family protein [Bacteroidetes bacterium]|nr:MAG: O-antigen ligase family protein [Bacteroidota bacterium]
MGSIRNITRESAHQAVFFFSLGMIAVSLPLSRYFITIGEILLIANWLAEGNFREKFRQLGADRPAIAFIIVYFVSVIGLLWSHDPASGIANDLLHKSPTLFLPLIFATTPAPERKKVRLILLLFIISVFIVSLTGLYIREFLGDPFFRSASPFIPGVYLGLMLVIAAAQLPLLAREVTGKGVWFYLSFVASGLFVFFLLYLRTLSAIFSLAVIVVFLLVVFVRRVRSTFLRITIPAITIVIAVMALWPIPRIYRQVNAGNRVDFSTLPAATENGTTYLHDTVSIIRENGYPVYIYLADSEIREAWNSRSSLDFDGSDLMGQELKPTIYRYMSSLGLRKDSAGMALLTDRDIREIERGTTNHLNVGRPGIYVRAYEEIMSLSIYYASGRRETSWGSLTKRIDLWRASLAAFRKHPMLGWGTGGVLKAMDYGMEQTGSTLAGLNMKPHSQYLFLLLSHGLAGFILAVLLMVYFFSQKKAHRSFMFMLFLILFLVSFLGNNSLESQPGQDLFVFFSMLYAYHYPLPGKGQIPEKEAATKEEPGFIC